MTTPSIVQTGRRLLGRYFLDSCLLLDAVKVRDATGGTVTSYVPRAQPLPCRWGTPTDDEATIVGGTVSGKTPVALSLPHGTVVAEGSQVRNPAQPTAAQPLGKLYSVVANRTPVSVMATQVRLVVREV